MMAYWLDLHLASSRIPYGRWFMSRLLHFPSSSLLWGWESSKGRPKVMEPCTHVGDPEEAPGSWLRIGSAIAIAAIAELTSRWKIFVSPSLYRSAFPMKITKP